MQAAGPTPSAETEAGCGCSPGTGWPWPPGPPGASGGRTSGSSFRPEPEPAPEVLRLHRHRRFRRGRGSAASGAAWSGHSGVVEFFFGILTHSTPRKIESWGNNKIVTNCYRFIVSLSLHPSSHFSGAGKNLCILTGRICPFFYQTSEFSEKIPWNLSLFLLTGETDCV